MLLFPYNSSFTETYVVNAKHILKLRNNKQMKNVLSRQCSVLFNKETSRLSVLCSSQ